MHANHRPTLNSQSAKQILINVLMISAKQNLVKKMIIVPKLIAKLMDQNQDAKNQHQMNVPKMHLNAHISIAKPLMERRTFIVKNHGARRLHHLQDVGIHQLLLNLHANMEILKIVMQIFVIKIIHCLIV